MKCAISWIDENGKPTPDDNEAIGLAICTSNMAFDMRFGDAVQAFPICAAHAAKLREYHVSWAGTPDEVVTEWRLIKFDDLKLRVKP